MPYYRITVTDVYGKVKQGVRFDNLTDIDAFHRKAYRKAITAMKNTLKSIDVVMLTSECAEVLKFLETKRNTAMSNTPPEEVYQGKYKPGYEQYKDV